MPPLGEDHEAERAPLRLGLFIYRNRSRKPRRILKITSLRRRTVIGWGLASALFINCFLGGAFGQVDPDSLLVQRRASGGTAVGNRSASLDLGDGVRAELAEIAGAILTQHAQWETAFRSAPKAVLFSAPQSSEEILDHGDGLTIVKTTRVVVSNPRELAAQSPAFSDFSNASGRIFRGSAARTHPRRRNGRGAHG